MKISSIDHLVLTVKNIQVTCQFYHQVLGMEVITFGDNRKALKFGEQKINLHQLGQEFEPKASSPTFGTGYGALRSL
jgi:catechol 2,3-dioxygenase-like lactoylglutathione lyase family enzyme